MNIMWLLQCLNLCCILVQCVGGSSQVNSCRCRMCVLKWWLSRNIDVLFISMFIMVMFIIMCMLVQLRLVMMLLVIRVMFFGSGMFVLYSSSVMNIDMQLCLVKMLIRCLSRFIGIFLLMLYVYFGLFGCCGGYMFGGQQFVQFGFFCIVQCVFVVFGYQCVVVLCYGLLFYVCQGFEEFYLLCFGFVYGCGCYQFLQCWIFWVFGVVFYQ